DCGDEPLTETSAPGAGFLADVTRAWEAATDPARAAGVRVVHVRSGLVLSRRGGALARLLPVFRAGLGGRLGNGRQWVSWIHVDDLVAAFARALEGDAITGPINAVAPNPVRQRDFAAALGRALRRPAWLPTPAVALRAALGAMADELLLFSQRALPERLAGAGFRWTHGDIGPALESLLRPGTGFG
ncbi:MAG: DUF1731 domain-containing protein, partial [Candidatus Eisenbacteria bacterium]|nr:DUF1731 domain-containing protein [Candidatus Eisenbacteria bacterium]